MTLPRQVVPSRDYMITRRCSERRFFLRPDQETNNAFIYCLVLAAKRANVDVTFSIAMSNHHHTGIHDPDGNFPIFTEHFHGLLARCQNAHLGHFENFWSSEPTSVVRLVEPNDILDKMTYAFTNPAAADLVDTVEEWPGVATFQATISGGHITATRPKHFFRDDGGMPEVVSLRIARPHGFEALEQDEWAHGEVPLPRVLFAQLLLCISENPCMTLPRQVVPSRDYMITRRCSERRFFLRPDQETNNAFIYCLVLAAKRANVDVTFSIAMSNHHHTGIHDPDGNFPIFTEHFHGLLARCQNAHLGHFENFWSSEPTSVVRLVEPNDILDKMTYAFTNPAAADLVDTVEEWPGVATFQATISGGHITATRPKHFFRDDGGMPEVVSLRIARPHGFEALEQDEWAHMVTERVRNKEAEHRQRRADKGITVLGRARILGQEPFHCPEGHAPRFQMNPRVAAKSKWARIEAILRNCAFIERYRDAFRSHMAGVANVLFPFGTFWMRKFGKVACEAAEVVESAVLGPPMDPTAA